MTATYRYSADGVKREVKIASSVPAGQPTAYAYLGSLVYSKVGGSYQLESTGFSGGRIVPSDTQHPVHYHITDHLGSVRVVAWPEEGDDAAVILEQNDYYPYGLRMDNGLTASTDNRYRFSGKEAQPLMDGSILDFGARYYNPTIARWTTIDPKAEKYYSTTPYSYCAGNPVMYVDPDGEMPQVAIVILGATVNIISGVVRGDSGEDILKSALAGAVEGGISSLTGLGLVKNLKNLTKAVVVVATEFTSSATGSALEQYLIEGEVDGGTVVLDIAFDAAADAIGFAVGKKISEDFLSDIVMPASKKEREEIYTAAGVLGSLFDNCTASIINFIKRQSE